MPDLVQMLEGQFGADWRAAIDPDTDGPSPLAGQKDTSWLKTANTVGINVRTIRHFWNIIPYALTLPYAQNAIHILPIWEPGVVASLYGPASWNINPEFFSPELEAYFPHLNTVEKQLKAVVNVLHLLGKAVGMDVVPHTDRFSEMALANPRFFEWLQRDNLTIRRHDSRVYQTVESLIFNYLENMGSAAPTLPIPATANAFFEEATEAERLQMLFGQPADYSGRLARRKILVQWLYENGFETLPATMGPPYRGIEVDPNPEARVTDEEGRIWRDYRITQPEPMSRVFGPLTRYKLYEPKDDNRDWALDFEAPNREAWAYVCGHYNAIQSRYGFDFMRGDMSHVQMRPGGVPEIRDGYYDLLGAVKQAVLPAKPYFGYFAESFLAAPGEMAYGDECDHLEASLADSTLGDLQSEPLGTGKFMTQFAQYRHWLATRRFAPNFTLMTGDKDDPRFDKFYLEGNELRYFLALFLTDMPSYMGLGFECRDPHPEAAPNEHYTKMYVFHMPEGSKGTQGPFVWGKNRRLYARLVRQKHLSDDILPRIGLQKLRWIVPPESNGTSRLLAWTQAEAPEFLFVANLDTHNSRLQVRLRLPEAGRWIWMFSTERESVLPDEFVSGDGQLDLQEILPGEGLVFVKKAG